MPSARGSRASGCIRWYAWSALVFALLAPMMLQACTPARPAALLESDPSLTTGTDRFEREVVAADHPAASAAGALILSQGGNAVDAAVATSFALSVVRPESCGIGGGGFMVIHLARDPRQCDDTSPPVPVDVVIDYRERAPGASSPDMFFTLPPGSSETSGRAVATPGTVAGLLHALERYGTMTRAQVIAPAIRLATEGFSTDAQSMRSAGTLQRFLEGRPDHPRNERDAAGRLFIRAQQAGATASNAPQADALSLIAQRGAPGFYDGPVADAVVRAVNRHAGGMTRADLESYRPKESTPLRADWRGRTILTVPLPSSGGITMIQALTLMDLCARHWGSGADALGDPGRNPGDPAFDPPPSAAYLHCLVESFKHAFADRAKYLGDTEFMPGDPTPRLLDRSRLAAKAAMIRPDRTLGTDDYARAQPLDDRAYRAPPPDDHGTSHFSIADRFGNAVACTETINLSFGSKIIVPEYGFCLNNQMDDFQTSASGANAFALVQSDRNRPEPGKRPLSSMTPTIVLDAHGRVEVVAGASGGPRIITATTQAVLDAVVLGLGAYGAALPRVHHQWKPETLQIESSSDMLRWRIAGTPMEHLSQGDSPSPRELAALEPYWRTRIDELRARGHSVIPMSEPAAAQVIARERSATGTAWHALCDPRKGGAPRGR